MIDAALIAADPYKLVQAHLETWQTSAKRLFVVSVGKAAVAMAHAASDGLADRLTAGIAISKLPMSHPDVQNLPAVIQHFQGSHPIPDASSVSATKAISTLLAETTPDDVVLCLISGGASALLTAPAIPLDAWQNLNDALLRCGCTINEVNHVRQHVDVVKGGGLLRWAAPAACQTFILSDVIGNELAHIGSGPTVPIEQDVARVKAILDQYDVWRYLSAETTTQLKHHLAHLASPAPYPASNNSVIGDVKFSAAAAASVAHAHGYTASVVSTELTGEASLIGQQLAQTLQTLPAGHCQIYGGETTVTLSESANGSGGRNQELALAAAIALDGGAENCYLATLATDGEDGPNAGAGAIVSAETIAQSKARNLDAAAYLANHDSYSFFDQLQIGHLRIGSTGTNVNDLTILLRPIE